MFGIEALYLMSVEENFSISQIKSLNEAGLFGSAQILVRLAFTRLLDCN